MWYHIREISSSLTDTPMSLLLCMLILSPEQISKHFNTLIRFFAFSKVHCPMKMASSAYWRRETSSSELTSRTPKKISFLCASLMATLSPSAAKMKRKGSSGSPCLTPLPILNSLVGQPLTRTETFVVHMHPFTHALHLSPNPICIKTLSKKFQFNKSRAFTKSTLKIRNFFLARLAQLIISFTIANNSVQNTFQSFRENLRYYLAKTAY